MPVADNRSIYLAFVSHLGSGGVARQAQLKVAGALNLTQLSAGYMTMLEQAEVLRDDWWDLGA